ncbi:MAG: 4Fe-4S dicluster domain-containing protein [Candidatus Eisenbacteria bacterium]|nr:4Fe-4S dicluster domain-containing protein [Candidatus Eisenbacteria bacterium]
MKELVVVSGKGGTGKTSVTASFAALSAEKVVADCDVDAADLHLILDPLPVRSEPFVGGAKAVIDGGLCTACGRCAEACRFDAIRRDEGDGGTYQVDEFGCEGCGVCLLVCPEGAVEMRDVVNGQLFVSDSRLGPFVHAKLGIAEENSGKLVTMVRREAKEVARENGIDLILIDGSPGIGCPVIASLTGASLALVVTEPTLSGFHDMKRICEVAEGLRTPAAVCVNKWDLNPDVSGAMEEWCDGKGLPLLGRVPYDGSVTDAQVEGLSVVEHSQGPASRAIRALWERIAERLPAG